MRVRKLGLALAIPASLFAQSMVTPEHLGDARAAFDGAAGGALRCQASNSRPALDFAFRFHAGYVINVPLAQFQGPGHRLTTLLRVTPEGHEPAYLTKTDLLPDDPLAKTDGEVVGRFVVGEGAYAVEAVVQDDLHRVCRTKWRMLAKRTGSERDLRAPTPPATVSEVSADAMPVAAPAAGPRIGRLTILLHATPFSMKAAKIEAGEVQMMTDALGSLLGQMPAESVRLVVFNLDQQTVLLRKDGFKADDLDQVATVMSQLQPAVVDYRTLQKKDKPGLAELLQAELREARPPDAVIVMGPKTRLRADAPEVAEQRQGYPPLFYLQFRPPRQFFAGRGGPPPMTEGSRGRGGGLSGINRVALPPDFPDSIGQLVSRYKGETLPIWTAHEFADAIKRMAVRIPAGTSAAPDPHD